MGQGESSIQGSSGIHSPRSDRVMSSLLLPFSAVIKRMCRSIGHISAISNLMILMITLQELFKNTQARTEVNVATQDESHGYRIRDLCQPARANRRCEN